MGRSKKKRSTFFTKKSEVLNASFIQKTRTVCSENILRLIGDDYQNRYSNPSDYFLAPQAEVILQFITDEISAGVPRLPISVMIEAYAWARQFDALSEKNVSLESDIDTKAVALEKFRAAEAHCKSINDGISEIYSSDPIAGFSARNVISRLQCKIKSYLQDVPELADVQCSFGPGATTTCRKRTSAKWKLSSQMACSRDSRNSLPELAALYPRLNWKSIKLGGGSLSFVPKNAKTARSIMTEPLVNAFVQRGIGSILKRRLLRKGCNLYDQTRNRDKARSASISNDEATIDLSAASDNIAFSVVRLLLPYEWYHFLATWRTDMAILAGNEHDEIFLLHKFSSMGNGYTFELESCIFYACGQVACELAGVSPNRVGTYGDDIIVPSEATEILFSILSLLGFTVNQEKSFWQGPFRESCGGDYLLGTDVRPFYVKDTITDARLVAFSNQVARSGHPNKAFRKHIERFIKPSNALLGPDGYGDGHLIGYDWDKVPYRPQDGYEGYIFRTYSKVPKRDLAEPSGFFLVPSYEAYLREFKVSIWIQGRVCLVNQHTMPSFLNHVRTVSYTRESDVHALRGGERSRIIRVSVPPNVA